MNNRYPGDYLTYKKNKAQMPVVKTPEPASKFKYLVRLFLITFLVIFIAIVILITKITSRIDIEYPAGDMNVSSDEGEIFEEEQKKIDKRLSLIQQEEKAPSEARILQSEKKSAEVIDPIHFEKSEQVERLNKMHENKQASAKSAPLPAQKDDKVSQLLAFKSEILKEVKQEAPQPKKEPEQNVTIMSKVVVGRYASFEDAKSFQNTVKERFPSGVPFVRKIGDIYAIQLGSYQDFNVAKKVARDAKAVGLDVWIYQQ